MARLPFEQLLLAYHRGEIGADVMLAGTMPRWRAIAGRLYKDWRTRLPAWVNDEDVLQVMCENVLRYAREYDASRNTSIGWYVVYNVSDKAEKAIHKWRNAVRSGNARAHASRIEMPMSVFAEESDETEERGRYLDPMLLAQEPTQHLSADAAEFFDAVLAHASTVREALALLALRASGGSLLHAAELLYENPRARLHCELGNENEAHRLVKLTMSDIAERYTSDET